ncbi:MAG: DegV family EDD domain-containing protein [Clostridiales bacterium]|jgi:DegV family protein with EDD domain|nr:DegV family EDD domain-containing protein [Clostridiales bacterium]
MQSSIAIIQNGRDKVFTLVADSSVCIKRPEAEALGLKIVPHSFTVNGRMYFETYSDENGNYERMLKGHSLFTTSHPNRSAFLSCFEEELAQGNEVLCITISSNLSESYSAARMAAKQAGSGKVTVLDSRLAGGGLHLLIREAHRLASSGLDRDAAAAQLMQRRELVRTAFAAGGKAPLQSRSFMSRVGDGIKDMMSVKPILMLRGGIIVSGSSVKGRSGIIRALTRDAPADVTELAVDYIGNSKLAAEILHILRHRLPNADILLHKIGPVLGIHLGFNAVAVSHAKFSSVKVEEESGNLLFLKEESEESTFLDDEDEFIESVLSNGASSEPESSQA